MLSHITNQRQIHSFRRLFTSVQRLRSVYQALDQISQTLDNGGVPEPRMSASHLLAKVVGTRSIDKLSSQFSCRDLSADEELQLSTYVQCRLARMPVQYIMGDWDFRSLTLKMRPPVFIPRPETEELVGHVLEHLTSHQEFQSEDSLNVLEVGCGSGAICLSLLKESPIWLRVLAVDQSEAACELTDENFKAATVEGCDWKGLLKIVNAKLHNETEDLGLERMIAPDSLDLIVSNPPYVLRKDVTNLPDEIKVYEDLRAVDGGKHGLDVIEPLLSCASKFLKPNRCMFLEVDPCHAYLIPQVIKDKSVVYQNLSVSSTIKDFNGNDRFVVIRK